MHRKYQDIHKLHLPNVFVWEKQFHFKWYSVTHIDDLYKYSFHDPFCESMLEYFNSFCIRVLWDNEGHIVHKWAYPCLSEVKDQFVNMLSDSLLVFGQYVKCHTFSFKCFDRHYYETYYFPIYIDLRNYGWYVHLQIHVLCKSLLETIV